MKLNEAIDIINSKINGVGSGYMVHFELVEGSVLKSDHFPDKHAGEKLIESEESAWELADKFARATGSDYINIYVVDERWRPVAGYDAQTYKKQ